MSKAVVKSEVLGKGRPPKDMRDPQWQAFVYHYTTPASDGFLNHNKAATEAGMTARTGRQLIKDQRIQAAINAVFEERMDKHASVTEYIDTFGMQAARELIAQLMAPEELRIMDPEEELGVNLGKVVDRDLAARAREINKHNANAIKLRDQSIKAAQLILAYAVGTPEQNINVKKQDARPNPLDLSKLSDEELKGLQAHIDGVVSSRKPQIAEVEEEHE